MSNIYIKSLDFSGDLGQLITLFKDRDYFFILESSFKDAHRGRYSFLGFNPVEIVKADGSESLDRLKEKYSFYMQNIKTDLTPFPAGIVGYISYDFGLSQENICLKEKEDEIPDIWFGFYKTILTIDHIENKIIISSIDSSAAIEEFEITINLSVIKDEGVNEISYEGNFRSNFSKVEYLIAVNKAREYIAQGDIYQVNLSQKFTLNYSGVLTNVIDIYEKLKNNSPSPFGCFLDCGDFKIISSSPERFLRLKDGVLQTRPMKGTAKRGSTFEEDEKNKSDLIMSEKERAELLMITDLLRNDLGRVCKYGTVTVKNRREIEAYKTVFQATSTIEGKLADDKNCFDVLRNMLPGGSITGCPKIRAMEIIEELEPSRRGIYTGIMGYISFSGGMDFNVLIRTLVLTDKKITYQVGGGIVHDSVAAKEYEETLLKAEAMQKTIEEVFSVESCR